MKRVIYLMALLTSLMTYSLSAQTIPVDNVSNSLPCLDKNFNVRVVIPVDSASRVPLLTEDEVDSLLQKASHYFSPICMSFTSCSYDVLANYSYGLIRRADRRQEMSILYHYPRRITLFVVQELDKGKCGYSILDGLNTRNKAQIFVSISCEDGLAEQFAHHMGTLLGLLDTNHDAGSELVNATNCQTAGDQICDTPADPYGMVRDTTGQWTAIQDSLLKDYTMGCDFVWNGKDENGEFFNPITTNLMSPYPCKCAFTREQFLKMVDNYDCTEHLKY